MANLGFVGLGLMGSRIVKRLLSSGHQVSGYNRTRAKAQSLIDAGMGWADTPRAVALPALAGGASSAAKREGDPWTGVLERRNEPAQESRQQ